MAGGNESQFAVGGLINPTTGKPFGNSTKKFLEWQKAQQKQVISFDKANLITAMNSGVRTELLQNGILCFKL